MRLKEIIERFTLVSGFERKDVSRWLPVIMDAKAYFEERIPALSEGDLRRVENACAVYAFYRISRMGRMDELRSFKVGDIQMNVEAVGEAARQLWEAERAGIADIVELGGDFAFRSVSV